MKTQWEDKHNKKLDHNEKIRSQWEDKITMQWEDEITMRR